MLNIDLRRIYLLRLRTGKSLPVLLSLEFLHNLSILFDLMQNRINDLGYARALLAGMQS